MDASRSTNARQPSLVVSGSCPSSSAARATLLITSLLRRVDRRRQTAPRLRAALYRDRRPLGPHLLIQSRCPAGTSRERENVSGCPPTPMHAWSLEAVIQSGAGARQQGRALLP